MLQQLEQVMPDNDASIADLIRATDSLLERAEDLRKPADEAARKAESEKDDANKSASLMEEARLAYVNAEKPLEEAVSILQPALSTREAAWDPARSTEASSDLCDLAGKLADV